MQVDRTDCSISRRLENRVKTLNPKNPPKPLMLSRGMAVQTLNPCHQQQHMKADPTSGPEEARNILCMQAYREWRNSSHESLFIINNDVLVPDGVIDKLAAALTPEGDC